MSDSGFSILSSSSESEINFSQFDRARETLHIHLRVRELEASSTISVFTDAFGLNRLLQSIGSLDQPWKGTKSWSSIEGDFSIQVTATSLGEVKFRVSLCRHAGTPEEWSIVAAVTTDFGQLARIECASNSFFNASNA